MLTFFAFLMFCIIAFLNDIPKDTQLIAWSIFSVGLMLTEGLVITAYLIIAYSRKDTNKANYKDDTNK